MVVMVGIEVVRCFLNIYEHLLLLTGALLEHIGGRSGCHCVMGGMLVSIQERTHMTIVQVRSMMHGEPSWHLLLAETRHLVTCRPMICELHGNS